MPELLFHWILLISCHHSVWSQDSTLRTPLFHSSAPGWHSVEAFLASLQKNVIVSKMCMLSPSLYSEDVQGKKFSQIFHPEQLSHYPVMLFAKITYGWERRFWVFFVLQGPLMTICHPLPHDLFHWITWW